MDYETSKILKRDDIRKIALYIRKAFKIRTIKFPVMKFLDILEKNYPDNVYVSVEEDELFDFNVMAELKQFDEEHYCIRIRESVYAKALKEDGPSLGYICHEICHFILIYILGIGPKMIKENGISFYKTISFNNKSYKSMEWQAMALCGELMIPYEKCKNYTYDQIISITKSSKKQALYFINHVRKGGGSYEQ